MDLFFEVWKELKFDYLLWRVVKCSIYKGISIKIYSKDSLIVSVSEENLDYEYAYLIAARDLIQWARRSEDHAKSSTNQGDFKWLEKLKEQLGGQDEVDNAAEGWQMLSL